LLIERVGVSGMPVLIGRSLDNVDGREISRGNCREEIVNIVPVIRRTVVSDLSDRRGPGMVGVRRGGVILKPCVVRDVVLGRSRQARRASIAAKASVRVDLGQVKPAHEGAPGDVGGVQQVANVASLHLNLVPGGVGTGITNRIRITNDRERSRSAVDLVTGAVQGCGHAIGLPGNQIQGPRSGRTEGGAEKVIVQRVILGIIPQRGHGISVVITKVQPGGRHNVGWRIRRRSGGADIQWEQIQQPSVESLLFRFVVVVLVTGYRLGGLVAPVAFAGFRLGLWISNAGVNPFTVGVVGNAWKGGSPFGLVASG